MASSGAEVAGVLQKAAMGVAGIPGLLVWAGYLLWADVWGGLAVLRLVTPLLFHTSHRQQEGIAAAGASASDVMQGVEVLRGIGGESRAGCWYRRHSQDAAEAAGTSGHLADAQLLLGGVVLLIAAGLGAWRAVKGR